jgi:3-oxoacyl-[acyl-carrier protein] reductase
MVRRTGLNQELETVMGLLEQKVVIVTGGAQGIGLRAAERFAEEGARVAIWDFNQEKGNAAVSALGEKGYNVRFQQVNVADMASVKAAAQALFEDTGKIDVLVNNAGITRDATLLKMTGEQWQQVIDVNLGGVFHCSQAVAPFMVEQKSGCIINTSSVVGLYGNFGQTNYVATKSGVIGMTKVWARELGRKGIRVNAVAPGFIATEMMDTVPEKVIEKMVGQTPLARMGQPEDIANAYLFLASDLASFVSGTVLSVDGGLVI